MNKEQDYASDSDESDEDFRPDDVADESPASEDEAEDSESNDGLNEDTEGLEKKSAKRKITAKPVNRKKAKSKQDDQSDEDTNTSKRTTRQRDVGTSEKGKHLEKDELVSDEEDKTHTNALWADFLKDVNTTQTLTKSNSSKVENKPCSSSYNGEEASKKIIKEKDQRIKGLTPKVEESKIVVTEVLDFAGEEISVQREIDASSIKENKAATVPTVKKQPFSRIMPGASVKRTGTMAATGSAPGLGSILNQLGKKKKLSVLEKSQMDWKSFKQTEGIDEQLQTFNKGKDGYLERQDFLQRTDLRQFEIEKSLRQTTRRPF